MTKRALPLQNIDLRSMVTAINVKEASKLKLARKLFVLILIMLLILVGCTKAGKEAATTPEPSNTDKIGRAHV